jgi:dipeptidyl aminopeptidase/acylaminoacyl peptidase
VKQITEGDSENHAPAWSPDGKQIAFSRARSGLTDFNISDLWMADADGKNARRISENMGRATSPSFSPDGKQIACYGLDEQKPGLGDPMVRVWIVSSEGHAARSLTKEFDRSAVLLPPPSDTLPPVWSDDGASVTFIAADAGNHHIVRATVADGSAKKIVTGERQIQVMSAAPRAGRLAFFASDSQTPGDAFTCAWDGSSESRLTQVNAELFAEIELPRVEKRAFKNPNGGTLEGWVTLPSNGKKPAPLLVEIHGGPHSYHGNAFPAGYFYSYVLAARGWATLALNPTGSGSYQKKFATAIWGRWGEHDLPEQFIAIDALIAEGIAELSARRS